MDQIIFYRLYILFICISGLENLKTFTNIQMNYTSGVVFSFVIAWTKRWIKQFYKRGNLKTTEKILFTHLKLYWLSIILAIQTINEITNLVWKRYLHFTDLTFNLILVLFLSLSKKCI